MTGDNEAGVYYTPEDLSNRGHAVVKFPVAPAASLEPEPVHCGQRLKSLLHSPKTVKFEVERGLAKKRPADPCFNLLVLVVRRASLLTTVLLSHSV